MIIKIYILFPSSLWDICGFSDYIMLIEITIKTLPLHTNKQTKKIFIIQDLPKKPLTCTLKIEKALVKTNTNSTLFFAKPRQKLKMMMLLTYVRTLNLNFEQLERLASCATKPRLMKARVLFDI